MSAENSTEKMRAALELIASGVGPIGGRLGYEQMREIARDAIRESHKDDVRVAIQVAAPPRELLARSVTRPPRSVTKKPTTSKSDAPRRTPVRKPSKPPAK